MHLQAVLCLCQTGKCGADVWSKFGNATAGCAFFSIGSHMISEEASYWALSISPRNWATSTVDFLQIRFKTTQLWRSQCAYIIYVTSYVLWSRLLMPIHTSVQSRNQFSPADISLVCSSVGSGSWEFDTQSLPKCGVCLGSPALVGQFRPQPRLAGIWHQPSSIETRLPSAFAVAACSTGEP